MGVFALFFMVLVVNVASAVSDNKGDGEKYSFNECDYSGNWSFCERGTVYSQIIVDNGGKVHITSHDVSNVVLYYNGKVVWRKGIQSIISANSKEPLDNGEFNSLFDFGTFIERYKGLSFFIEDNEICIINFFNKMNNFEWVTQEEWTKCYIIN